MKFYNSLLTMHFARIIDNLKDNPENLALSTMMPRKDSTGEIPQKEYLIDVGCIEETYAYEEEYNRDKDFDLLSKYLGEAFFSIKEPEIISAGKQLAWAIRPFVGSKMNVGITETIDAIARNIDAAIARETNTIAMKLQLCIAAIKEHRDTFVNLKNEDRAWAGKKIEKIDLLLKTIEG